MIKGGVPTGAMSSRPHGMQITASVYGKTVKLIYGLTQAAPDLVWYNDWQAADHPSNTLLSSLFPQASGKKSGKSGKKGGSSTKYYSAALDLLLGHAPIFGVMSAWMNNLKLAVLIHSATGTVSGGAFSFTPDGALAGILACTVNEAYTATFDDFGGPGEVSVSGNWDRPLWNSAFGVPGRIDGGAYTARDPYSWSWDFSTPTATFPAALEGTTVTVYYGVPAIYKSDGTFFSSTNTPLEILNLEFEREFASGSEYANHAEQQLVQSWISGLGSVRFDLGVSNTMPNLNLEVLGAFTLWPNGDCDVADIVADIIFSGPVIV